MKKQLRNLYNKLENAVRIPDAELSTLIRFLGNAGIGPGSRLVEVGCGYGRVLKTLSQHGIDAVGVEINPEIVKKNREEGLNCILPSDVETWDRESIDCLIFYHVIEHFSHNALVEFLDKYLDFLKPNGHIIIATPLLTSSFFDDFDHVKPYQPNALLMVFGPHQCQVQYYSRNQFDLLNLWFRREPFRVKFQRSLYFDSWNKFFGLMNIFFSLSFRLSGKIAGKNTGWVGVFRKIEKTI